MLFIEELVMNYPSVSLFSSSETTMLWQGIYNYFIKDHAELHRTQLATIEQREKHVTDADSDKMSSNSLF